MHLKSWIYKISDFFWSDSTSEQTLKSFAFKFKITRYFKLVYLGDPSVIIVDKPC